MNAQLGGPARPMDQWSRVSLLTTRKCRCWWFKVAILKISSFFPKQRLKSLVVNGYPPNEANSTLKLQPTSFVDPVRPWGWHFKAPQHTFMGSYLPNLWGCHAAMPKKTPLIDVVHMFVPLKILFLIGCGDDPWPMFCPCWLRLEPGKMPRCWKSLIFHGAITVCVHNLSRMFRHVHHFVHHFPMFFQVGWWFE